MLKLKCCAVVEFELVVVDGDVLHQLGLPPAVGHRVEAADHDPLEGGGGPPGPHQPPHHLQGGRGDHLQPCEGELALNEGDGGAASPPIGPRV